MVSSSFSHRGRDGDFSQHHQFLLMVGQKIAVQMY
jgi:hypothetical protein